MSILNNTTLINTIKKGTLATFNKQYDSYESLWRMYADEVESNAAVEDYSSIGEPPSLQEFKDELKPGVIYDYGYSLKNNEYTSALMVPQSTIEDQQFGMLNAKIKKMADLANEFIDEHMADTLAQGEAGLTREKQPLFATNHVAGANQTPQSNLLNGVLNAESFANAIKAMRRFKNDQNKPISIRPELLMVPPELEDMAMKLLSATLVDGGDTNINNKRVNYLVNPWFKNPTSWYLKAQRNSVFWQNRVSAEFVAVDPRTSGNQAQQWLFYVRLRGKGGYDDWRYTVKSK